MVNIGVYQKNLIKKVKFFFKDKLFDEIFSRLDLFYFCPSGSFKGSAYLIFFFDKFLSIKIFLIAFIKDFIKLFFLNEFQTLNHNNKKYKKIIVNWGNKESFSKKGEYFDKHLNIWSNKCPNVQWYVIYMDKVLPKNINKNIILVFKKKNRLNLKTILTVLKTIIKKKSFKYINQEFSELSIFATFVSKNFQKLIHKNLEKVLMPYEGQPFQNSIFMKIHQLNKKTETVGYVHSFPIGLPTNLIRRAGHPKKIIINSEAQEYCLRNSLCWRKNQLLLLPSCRFFKKSKFKMNNTIFLPIQFKNSNFIIKELKKLIKIKKLNLTKFKIKNHPSCLKSKKHLFLIKKLQELISNNKSNNKYDKNLSIFIGSTGSVIEALERNIKVLQICEIPILESYSKLIWKHIETKILSDNIFEYGKIKKFGLIKFGDNKNLYKKYIN